MTKKKILIYGIGSLQNRGCEALVNSSISQIDEDIEIVAATFDYEHDKDMYKERIKKFVNHHRHNQESLTEEEKELEKYYQSIPFDYNNFELLYQKDVVDEMRNADLCIHIGGDNYCYGVNEWMFSLNEKAKQLGKKTVLWGASLFDEINDLDLINDLNKYDLLMLREKISYNAIKKYINEDKLMLIPDPAFSLKTKKVKLNSWYSKKKIVGLNLSPLTIKTDEQYNAVKTMINYIIKETNYGIALLPHVTLDEASDLKVLKRLADDYKDNKKVYLECGNYDCQQLKYIISKCDLLIAARTHASIAAYSTLVPTMVIGYSVKSRGIAEDIFGNYKDYVLPADEINENTLLERFNYLNDNKLKIRNHLKEKIPKIIEKSSTLFNQMQEKLTFLEKKNICPSSKCTGCNACYNICPVDAIEIIETKDGYRYPKRDLNKCTNCGLCKKVCPILNRPTTETNTFNLKCYAAKSKDDNIRKKSSSGGIFYFLATEILKNNGIIYGATIEDFKVKHQRITSKEELEKLHGSKYAQSNILKNYLSVKNDLDNNKKVLFSGTPCQILGLKSFLKKDYKNLITVSVICHGVINDKLLDKRIKEFEENFETKVNNVKYKSKKNGWDKSSIEFNSERMDKSYTFNDDYLMYLYINNYILRESCYDCPAKGLENNLADIVLGDYWGIYYEHYNMFDKLGVSAVILKSKKAAQLFNKIKNKLELEDTNYESIIKYNEAFIKSMKRPRERILLPNELERNTLKELKEKYELKDKGINKEELDKVLSEKVYLEQELEKIHNSKRFKIINKIGNILNRIRRRK